MQRLHRLWVYVVLILAGCNAERLPDGGTPNQPPTVWVQAESPVAADESFSVHFEWGGVDADGEVSHYQFLIIDNDDGMIDPANVTGDWTSVFGTDSTIVFSTPPPTNEDETVVEPSYTFFVRAVDNEMLPSTEPDYIAFTPKSLLPAVVITVPSAGLGITPADVPPVSTFQWDTAAGSEEPDSVQWALLNTSAFNNSYLQAITYLRTVLDAPEWSTWAWFDNPSGKGREFTTPALDFGDYVFAVRAKKVVGAMNPVLTEPVNVRRIKVQARETGPTLVVHNSYYGHTVSASCDFPLTIVDFAAGIPVSFTLAACAEHYGGTIAGYRYGWDILDLDDPDQWEIDYTPLPGPSVTTPPRAFAFGTHVFTAEAIDNSGLCSRIQVRLNIVRFTGERNLLIVDDDRADEVPGQSGWDVTNGGIPSDAEHDAFWLDMVSDVDQFDPAIDMIAISTNREIPLATLAQYKGIVWSSFSDIDMRSASDLPYLATFIRYRAALMPANMLGACSPTGGVLGQVVANAISMALQAGQHLLITGRHPIQNVVSRFQPGTLRWPMIPLYELESPSTQMGTQPRYLVERPGLFGFTYQDLCLDVIDFGYLTIGRARVRGTGSPANHRYCPINTWRTPNAQSFRDDTMRSGLPLDPSFPAISLRPEAAGPGRFYNAASQGLDIEVYNPAYFRRGAACEFVWPPRSCFEPIYGLVSLDTAELTYQQPVAFWTSANADVVADFPGAVAARSAVFGFPPVFFNPGEIKPAIEYILFDEWQLPRNPLATSSAR